MKNKIFIVIGDPNSINSEIILKTWRKLSSKLKKKIFFIGNLQLLKSQYKKLKISVNLSQVKHPMTDNKTNLMKIINLPLKFNDCFKVNFTEASRYVVKSLNLAHHLAQEKDSIGLINCPIDKKLIKTKNIYGVTEFLGSKSDKPINSEVMMLHNKKLSVVPITTHQNIKDVSKNISSKIIVNKVRILDIYYKKLFKKRPKIAVLGLNPHNAELSKTSEEIKTIIPAIKKLKNTGSYIKGPFVADTFFMNDYKKFDVVVGMYHDQVLVPFKTLYKFDAINITLGLNYIRVSPDHGTAIKFIGKNKANYNSLLQCIKFINKLN